MPKEQPPAYYDRIYINARKYRRHYSGVRWLEMFKKASLHCGQNILEIGCGVGQFAHLLHDKGFLFYHGVDFSKVAILRAEALKLKGFHFHLGNIYEPDWYEGRTEEGQGFTYDTVVALETLEHVRDMEVLEMIPEGTRLVLSLPTFSNEAHLIHFTDANAIVDRYDELMRFEYIEHISDWFLFSAIKK